jgi:hypothetical protein
MHDARCFLSIIIIFTTVLTLVGDILVRNYKGQETLIDATEQRKESKHYKAWLIFSMAMTLLFFHKLQCSLTENEQEKVFGCGVER